MTTHRRCGYRLSCNICGRTLASITKVLRIIAKTHQVLSKLYDKLQETIQINRVEDAAVIPSALCRIRRAHNPKVVGSNPVPATKNIKVIGQVRWLFWRRKTCRSPRYAGFRFLLGEAMDGHRIALFPESKSLLDVAPGQKGCDGLLVEVEPLVLPAGYCPCEGATGVPLPPLLPVAPSSLARSNRCRIRQEKNSGASIPPA